MRIALLSYRSKPHVGGQGIYVQRLSAALRRQGHQVHVFSGQPYPQELHPGIEFTPVPSLDLYNDETPFKTPPVGSWRTMTDVTELADMWTAGFGEPRTFAHRVADLLSNRVADFDVVHDNQSLGYGLLRMQRRGLPVVATVHHPIARDRAIDLAAAANWGERFTKRRWYGFLGMQRRVARRLPGMLTVSAAAAGDIAADFDIDPARVHVVPCGVDTTTFDPAITDPVPGRIVCTASAATPLKGVAQLLQAMAHPALTAVPHAHLELVSNITAGSPMDKLINTLGIGDRVRLHSNLTTSHLAKLVASSSVVCVPSRYEGFSLPTLEAMASGRPVVGSNIGALQELLGTQGECGTLVPPGCVDSLAEELARSLSHPNTSAAQGIRARQRAAAAYTWDAVARSTVTFYETALAQHPTSPSMHPSHGVSSQP